MPSSGHRQAESPRSAPRSIFQYVEILRERWISALFAFVVVASLVAVHALFATPSFTSQALLQIEMFGAANDDLADITLAMPQANIDAELEVMSSYTVARRAAVIGGLGVTIGEEHAYRPYESWRRRLSGKPGPVRLDAGLVTRPLPREDLSVQFDFDGRGTSFTIYQLPSRRKLGVRQFDSTRTTQIELAGVTLELDAGGNRPRHGLYELKIHAGEAPDRVLPTLRSDDDFPPPVASSGGEDPDEDDPADAAARRAPAPPLAVRTALRAMPLHRAQADIRFDAEGRHIEVIPVGTSERATASATYDWDPAQGAEIEFVGERLRIAPIEGDPAGRTFRLRLYPEEDAAALVQQRGFAKQVGAWTGMVHIGANADDPYVARRYADALAQSYLELKRRRKDDQIINRLSWLRVQLEEESRDLQRALLVRDQFIRDQDAIMLSEKAAAAFEAQSTLFEQKLHQQELLDRAAATLAALEQTQTPEQILAVMDDSKVDAQTLAVADNLVQLRVRRGTLLRQRSTEADLPVKAIDAEIAELETLLASRVSGLVREAAAEIRRRIAASRERLERIETESAKHAEVLKSLPTLERELAQKNRAVEAASQRYDFLEKMKGETEIALTSTMTQVTLVDPALLNTARQSPVLFRRAIVAFMLGLFAACVIALLRHLRDRTVQNPGDVEDRVGLTVLAAVPDFQSVPRRQRKGLTGSLVVHEIPSSTVAEHYRTLRANIRFADSEKPIQALTMTSAVPGEGKTVSTLNLALAMAKAGNRVIVIDADLRRPMVNTHLEGARSPGVTELLEGEIAWRDAIQQFEDTGLDFIPAGEPHANPSALFEGQAFERFLAELRESYEYVLFDVPPVLAVADAAGFFSSLDAVLLVVRQGACPATVAAGAREQVERFGGNLIGAVFNGFDAKRAASKRYSSSNYYGYYGYYGSKGYESTDTDAAADAGAKRGKRAGSADA